MKNGIYHIKDDKIYKMSLDKPEEQMGTVASVEDRNNLIDGFANIDDKQKYVTQKNEMYSLYEKLENNASMRMTWIKNKLPWYITKFCKISSTEMELRSTDILIGVNIGKSKSANFYIRITPKDIGWE